MFGPPSKSTRGLSVLPRVSTDRFCSTMASASELSTSSFGMPVFTRLTMSVSANTPHLAATWCSFSSEKCRLVAKPGSAPTLIMHLSMVAPVPEAHLSFMLVVAVFAPVFVSCLNMMILASCPPSSITLSTSGCLCSTAIVTAFTSCTNLPPVGAAIGPEPEPVTNMRNDSGARSGNAARIASSSSSTFSGCLV